MRRQPRVFQVVHNLVGNLIHCMPLCHGSEFPVIHFSHPFTKNPSPEKQPSRSFNLLPHQVVGYDARAGFDKLLFCFGERVRKVALDIKLGREFLVHVNGDNDLRLHQGRSRKVARVFGDILDDDYLAAGSRRPAESGVDGETRTD